MNSMFPFKKGNAKKIIIQNVWYSGDIFYQIIYLDQILPYHR